MLIASKLSRKLNTIAKIELREDPWTPSPEKLGVYGFVDPQPKSETAEENVVYRQHAR